MNARLPDDPRPTLVERVRAADLRAVWRGADRRRWGVAAGLVVAIVAVPLATIVGAGIAENRVRAEIATLEKATALAPDRREPSSQPRLGATLETLARALPQDALLTAAGRGADGRLRIEVSTADPDQLRTALRRDERLRNLRDAGQRPGDGAIVVTLEEAR